MTDPMHPSADGFAKRSCANYRRIENRMTSAKKSEIPWNRIGKSLAELLRYERKIGHYEHASCALLSTVVHETGGCVWRRFLLDDENFAAVVSQVIAISDGDTENPKAVLESIRKLVEAAYAHNPGSAASFLKAYLKHRPGFPGPVRDKLDHLSMTRKRHIPLRAAAFVSDMDRLQPFDPDDGAAQEVSRHWYEQIIRGNVTTRQARRIPAQMRAARDRLLDHLREVEKDDQIDEEAICGRYTRVFKSTDIPALTDVIIGMHRFNLIRHFQVKFDVEQIERFLRNFPKVEVLRRFETLEGWMGKFHKTNHDGTILTPPLVNFLSKKSDFESLLDELDRYREDTRRGCFDINNVLQKHLEFRRFAYEYTRVLEPLTYQLRGRYPPPKSTEELYQLFNELEELPPPAEDEFRLDEQHLVEIGRAAYEAVGFLKFLRAFRAHTSRHIVVVGNDRYGRQWVVEPIEDYLRDGFTIRYDRVRSGTSMRLAVPPAFPREFVREIDEHTPHIVIVDGSHPPPGVDVMQLSRALRDYANWFVVFNDLRAEGDGARYQHESSLPADHFPEIMKWHEYTTQRQQLREWVTPGQTYRVTTWAPELKDFVILGDMKVPRHHEEIGGDRPLVVLANAIIYRTEGDDLPDALRGTTPRYFDDPDAHVKDSIVFGFGPHGLETRQGTSTERFVGTVQRHIKTEIDRLLKNSPQPGA